MHTLIQYDRTSVWSRLFQIRRERHADLTALAVAEGRRGLDVLTLQATDKGRPLYAKLGWTPGKEMVLALK
jgi:hypothetical protein